MKSEQEIRARLREYEKDPRHSYPPAKVHINAPLALMQVGIDASIAALKWVLE
ncbi:MAG: hypothetical protein JW993_10185 [Sedimentisphaerales bacterium]|nr:hypothetical protein [Sedimentisphaerales bacterium]